MSGIGNLASLFKPSDGEENKGIINWLLSVIYVPISIFLRFIQLIKEIIDTLSALFFTILANLHWILLFAFIFILGSIWFANLNVILTRGEHLWRCTVYEVWDDPIEDIARLARDVYNKLVCWTNALAFIYRLFGLKVFVETLRECPNGFDFFDWVRLAAEIIFQFISDVLRWAFTTNSINSAFPAYNTLYPLIFEFLPSSVDGMICLCADIAIFVEWIGKIFQSLPLVCIFHQLINVVLGAIQVLVQFIFDLLSLILMVLFGGGSGTDTSDILTGVTTGDTVLPSLSKTTLKERIGAAAVYMGIFLNDVFQRTLCWFRSELDSNGDPALVEGLYTTCLADPDTRYNLFCIIGPIVAGYFRLYSLPFNLLVNLPRILQEIVNMPPGDRYLTEVWWDQRWDYFFDTVRIPVPTKDYSVSLNFPTIVPGTGMSSIFFPNEDLYGPDLNLTCTNLDNDREMVSCLECPEVAEEDGETCVCKTAFDLDRLTEPVIGIRFWKPWICCLVSRVIRVGVAFARLAVGAVVHLFHFDRLLLFLADQNHYDTIFTELVGEPYVVGGVLECIREIVLGIDDRLRCLADIFIKPVKAIAEFIRIVVIAVVRFLNDILGTGEPGFFDYMCITDASNCVEVERTLSHWRRPRENVGYDPLFEYHPPDITFEPAFIDCLCQMLNFEFLSQFLNDPPDLLPDFCCGLEFGFRFFIECFKLAGEIFLTLFEMVASLFVPSKPITFILLEYLGCTSAETCSNIGDIVSDLEDVLNCPCAFIFTLDDIISDPPETEFFCICDLITGVVRAIIFASRAVVLFSSCIIQIIHCIPIGWPVPECGDNLHARLTKGFEYVYDSLEAITTIFGSIGCLLGLPFVGFGIDCLGTTFAWPLDHKDCETSATGFGVCTASDRFFALGQKIGELIVFIFKFIVERLNDFVDLAWGFLLAGDPDITGTVSEVLEDFLLEIGEPLWGISGKTLTEDFSKTFYPWPNTTGLNYTRAEQELEIVNDSGYVLSGWTYDEPPTGIVYNKTFNFTDNPNITETTGVLQATGLLVNCLLGLPTDTCQGNMTFAAVESEFLAQGGCIGDILIVVGNVLRDVWAKVVRVFVAGINVLTSLFFDPGNLGVAAIEFFQSVLELLIIIVGSASVLVDAALGIIIETARFFFGDGVAEMFRFFLEYVSVVIDLFIMVIESLLEPFFAEKKRFENVDSFFADNQEALFEAYKKGYENYYVKVTEKTSNDKSPPFTNETKSESKRNILEEEDGEYALFWKRLRSEDFGDEEIDKMTDGTFCKKVMSELKRKTRFNGMKLAQEALWKTCFILYSLPNEIYGLSSGKLHLPQDVFYNPSTFFPIIKNAVGGVGEMLEWKLQHGGSFGAPVTSYTELIDVPEVIMEKAREQLEIHRDQVDSLLVDGKEQYSRKRGKFDLHKMKKKMFPNKEFFEESGKLDYERRFCTTLGNKIQCVDDFSFVKGYTLHMGSPNDMAKEHSKRGFTGSQSGFNYDVADNTGYNSPFINTGVIVYNSLRGDFLLNLTKIGKIFPVIDGKIAYTFNDMTMKDVLLRKGLKSNLNEFIARSVDDFQERDLKQAYLKFDSNIYHFSEYLNEKNHGEYDQEEVYRYYRDAFGNFSQRHQNSNTQKRDGMDGERKMNDYEQDDMNPSLFEKGMTAFNRFYFDLISKKRSSFYDFSMFSNEKTPNPDEVSEKEQKILKGERKKDRDYFYNNIHTDGKPKGFKKASDRLKKVLNSFFGYSASLLSSKENKERAWTRADLKKGYNKARDVLRKTKDTFFDHDIKLHSLPNGYNFKARKNFKKRNSDHGEEFRKHVAERSRIVTEERKRIKQKGVIYHYFTEVIPHAIYHLIKTANGYWKYQNAVLKQPVYQGSPSTKRSGLWENDFNNEEMDENATLYGYGRWLYENITDDKGQIYSKEDVVYVMTDVFGSLRLYETLEITHLDESNPPNSEDRFGFFNKNPNARATYGSKKFQQESLVLKINYYEYNYMTQAKRRKCLNDRIWIEQVNVTLGGSNSTLVKIQQCYRVYSSLQPKNHPHQKAYGHILKGQSLHSHRWDMFKEAMGNIYANVSKKVNPKNMLANFRKVYVDPQVRKHRETFTKHNRVPGIYRLVSSYEELRKKVLKTLYKRDTGRFTLPDLIKVSLGHPDKMKELGYDEEWVEAEFNRVVKQKYNISMSPKESEILKRAHRPPLLDICLPQAPGDNITSCASCTGCAVQECSICSSCENCTLVSGSTYECEECGSCRVEGPYCKGECFNCTDCVNEVKCLDCELVLRLLSYIVDYVNFCVRKELFNDTSVIIEPLPGTSLINLIPYTGGVGFFANDTSAAGIVEGSCAKPYFTVYADGSVIKVFTDFILGGLSMLVGFDIQATAIDFFENTNLDPFNGPVGLRFFALRRLPIPFVGRCNRDIDTQCTFGQGFEKGLIYASIITLVLGFLMWFISPPIGGLFGNLLTAVGFTAFFWTTVASIAWFWNPACLSAPAFVLFDVFFNTGIPPPPILPECAADEIYEFLNKTLQRCIGFIPPSITIDNITCPDTCDDFVNFVNFTDLGFTNAYTIIGYAGQRFIPDPLNFWFNDYLSTTCLVQGGCSFGIMGAANTGPLFPFFEVDFSDGIANMTDRFDNSFFFVLPGIVNLIWPIAVVAILLYLGINIGVAILNFIIFLLRDTPLRQIFPWARDLENIKSPIMLQGSANRRLNRGDTSGNERGRARSNRRRKPARKKSGAKDKNKSSKGTQKSETKQDKTKNANPGSKSKGNSKSGSVAKQKSGSDKKVGGSRKDKPVRRSKSPTEVKNNTSKTTKSQKGTKVGESKKKK